MGTLGGLSVFGGGVACCGLLFFLGCVALVVWYAVRGPKAKPATSAPESTEYPATGSTADHSAAPAEPVAGGSHDADE